MAYGDTTNISFAQRIRIRLFLEGVEIPVIAANITASPNSPSVCSLQIPPLVQATRLLPRTLVHVFFQDAYETVNPYLYDKALASANPDNSPTNREEQVNDISPNDNVIVAAAPCGDVRPKDWSNRRYKLCFVGEVMGFTWSKSPMNRSILLQCEDLSNYWDYAYQWSNTGIFGPGLKAMFSGGATNLFTDFLTSQGSVLTQLILQGKCNTFPELGGLAAGVVRLIESIGGSYYVKENKKGLKKFAGQNVFFSLAELRLHITQQVAAYEKDPTSRRLLSRGSWGGLFNRVLGGLGQQVSIRKALSSITRVMFHEIYPQPCPRYKPGTDPSPNGTRRIRISQDPKLSIYASTAEQVLAQVKGLVSDLDSLRSSDQELGQDTLSTFQDYKITLNQQSLLMSQQQTTMSGVNAPSELVSVYSTVQRILRVVSPQVPDWRPNNAVDSAITPQLARVVEQLNRVRDFNANAPNIKERTPPQLLQQVIRPDIWFGAPPRCNVLFPDMYENLSYQRMFLQEPTRLMLKTNDEFFGEDFLFDKFYFAPQAGTAKRDKARMQDMLRNELLDHEIFTGILPIFEKMGEFNVHASRAEKKTKSQSRLQKVGFAQRATNFLYFKHRFNARQFQVSARFNPYVAVGFPGLVIDRWVDQNATERIREIRDKYISADPSSRNQILPKYTQELLGANFLANFLEVTHSLSQESLTGNTQIRCNYARQPDESVEFLGIEDAAEVQKRQEGDARRTTNVAAVSPPPLQALGPSGGVIVGVQDVTDKYRSGAQLPVYFSGASAEGDRNKFDGVRVPVSVRFTPEDLPAGDRRVISQYIGSETQDLLFRAYLVEEEVPRYKKEEAAVAAEELIRPGWYGEAWSSGKIGEVYQDFFGVGAITEATVVLDSGSSGASEAYEEALAEAGNAESFDQAIRTLPLITSLGEGSTIQEATEFLTLTYSYVKQAGLDADEFIRSYTWRPIATLYDMFGSEDLEFNQDGTEVVAGIEGFHSRAFGPYEDLFGLVTPEVSTVLGVKRGSTTSQKMDTRKRKFEQVNALRAALSAGTAQIG